MGSWAVKVRSMIVRSMIVVGLAPWGLAGSGQSLLLEGVVPLCLQGVFPEWRDKLERTRIRLQTEVRMEAVDVLFHLNILCNRL